MAKTLDKNRSYGTVFGGGGEAFEQDGVLFDMFGNEVVSEIVAVAGEHHEKPRRGRPKANPIDDQLAAQLEG